MPGELPCDYRTVSLEAEQRHDQLCDEFERAWQGGEGPRIEEWLPRVPDSERPALFVNLAKVERDMRGSADVAADLVERFPIFADWIQTVFRDGTDFDLDDAPAPLPAIPDYQVLEKIAVGGMGVVYKAVQLGLDRIVALKMVRGGAWVKEDERRRFLIEAKAVAGLDHPNIVRIHDFGELDGIPYFTMEYVDGGSLSNRLVREPFGFREAAELMEVVARAIQTVHDRRIVHRDLKPGNILLTKDGAPKISDFGLAKRLGADLSITEPGMVMGTASYMAPEQARGDKDIAPAADIYALGAIFYECLAGQPPFRDETYQKTIQRVIDEEPRRPREIITLIPEELETICLKCLEKDPARRYPTAARFADDLRNYLDGKEISIRPSTELERHSRFAVKAGYTDLKPAGSTAWAFVYRAREASVGRRVVLHICSGPSGSAAHARLLRQAEAMASPPHPNVEQLHTSGESAGLPFFVHEHIDGHSISAVLHERADGPAVGGDDPSAAVARVRLPPRKPFTPFTPAIAAQHVRDIARALHHVHECGVLHCGIYPGELRLTREAVPKLCGFEAAQKLRSGVPPREARASWVAPNYQPPEQIAEDWAALGPASDVYALGAVLYELIAGQVPFAGFDSEGTRRAVLEELPVAPRTLNPAVPDFLDGICLRCLAKQPAERFPSARELAKQLDRFLHDEIPQGHVDSAEDTVTIDPGAAVERGQPGDYELHVYTNYSAKPAVHALPRGMVEIGRHPSSDIFIDDDRCSNHHCAVYWDEAASQYVLLLRKAKNGVWINKVKVRRLQALVAGDTITVPAAEIVFCRKPA